MRIGGEEPQARDGRMLDGRGALVSGAPSTRRKLYTVSILALAALLSSASVLETGVRTAEIGRQIEECCACMSAEHCLPSGQTEDACTSQYNPVGAMTNRLEVRAKARECYRVCEACVRLEDDYAVTFVIDDGRT